jgi:indolepyruvate ferredoxin oxidoreductase alpha subunit
MEVAIGASISGVRAITAMKHVGVNVAADPLFTASYSGVGGGLVLAVADDPGMYSSQNEQDSRMVARAALVPVLEPSDSQEAKDFTKLAFELSERFDTPVMVRSTTRLSHSQGLVELQERQDIPDRTYEKNIAKYVMIPTNAIKRHPLVEKRMQAMEQETFDINRAEYNDLSIGFITSGIPYLYVKEAMPEASVLKLGMVNPLPRKLIEEFAAKVEKLYVFEELEPVIEEQVRSWGIRVTGGKEIFTRLGEYSAALLREKVLNKPVVAEPPAAVPARPPVLCSGCSHRSVFTALNQLKLHASGDIGCYTLGAVPPLSVIETTICMGASISMLHGMEKGRGQEYVKNWVAVIGDSTFLHTGVNSLMNMVYNRATGTVLILDNSTTGMTGHQDHPATGRNLRGEPAPIIDMAALCRAMGIKRVHEINALDLENLKELLKAETAAEELSVIITKTPCVLLKGQVFPNRCQEIPGNCKKCGACLKPGCPSLTRLPDKNIHINSATCSGCGLCRRLCRFEAIETLVR